MFKHMHTLKHLHRAHDHLWEVGSGADFAPSQNLPRLNVLQLHSGIPVRAPKGLVHGLRGGVEAGRELGSPHVLFHTAWGLTIL